jgi:hypothetical protein
MLPDQIGSNQSRYLQADPGRHLHGGVLPEDDGLQRLQLPLAAQDLVQGDLGFRGCRR